MTTFDLTAFAQYVIMRAILGFAIWAQISFTEIALLCPADGQYKKL